MTKNLIALVLNAALANCLLRQAMAQDNLEFSMTDLNRAEIRLELAGNAPLLPRLPVLLQIVITNPSAADIIVPVPTFSRRDNPFNTLDVLYAYNDESPERISFVAPNFDAWKTGVNPPRPELIRLRPGEAWSVRIPVSYDWLPENPKLIVDTGRLRFWARLCGLYRDQRGEFDVLRELGKSSAALPVEIVTPQGDDAAALTELLRLERPWILCAPEAVDHIPHTGYFQSLQDIATRHSQSPYALYARSVVARMLARGDRTDADSSRQPDEALAIQLLREILEDTRFSIREDASLLLGELLFKIGEYEECSNRVRQAMQEFPGGRNNDQLQHYLYVAGNRLSDRVPINQPDAPIQRAERELIAAGYDLTNLTQATQEALVSAVFEGWGEDLGQDSHSTEFIWAEIVRRYKAWVISNLTPVNRPADTTPPQVTCPAPIAPGCNVSLTVPVTFSATATDNVDTNVTVACSPVSSSRFKVGQTTVTCTARDASGNTNSCTFTVTRPALGFTGFLAPIGGADGTGGTYTQPMRTFKLGSKIPVKFTASCSGSAVTNGVHALQVIKWSNETTSAEPIDASPADAATTGNQFRLTSANEWHYNLDTATTAMTVGTWELRATLSDGSSHSAFIALK